MGSKVPFHIPFKSFLSFEFPYSMTLTNKGVKREYQKILNIFTAMDLSCNNFEGQIPQSLQDLHGLESLNLSNNHFTGSILPSLGNLKNLESLDLSHNELSGQIPQKLLQLGFLAILNVSFNHLDGQIPQGKQFNIFENNSYLGNLELCGKPLSKECKNSKVLTALPPTSSNEYESLLPSDIIDWMVILLGVGSGSNRGISKPVLNPPQLIDSFIFVHSSSLSFMAKSIHVFALILALRYVLESSLATKFSSLSHADECSLLFQFIESMSVNSYASSDSRAHPKFALWNLNISEGATSCCLWDGVECRSCHVIGLDLINNLLYGPNYANSSLFNLIHLHSLNIADI
ncbi:hypothetical protein L1987_84689 [Smallanthus sonchifolius]|uniref:Uncharacterized protein n=1 Tax=Smallanthus sonchifolius TaxID=185202 RepID=A0ACB8XUF5_9ASTR|nr:hypothetical protein L1987_84689 [Smallanthus sonchifolius]